MGQYYGVIAGNSDGTDPHSFPIPFAFPLHNPFLSYSFPIHFKYNNAKYMGRKMRNFSHYLLHIFFILLLCLLKECRIDPKANKKAHIRSVYDT